jgi:hypothetical protein
MGDSFLEYSVCMRVLTNFTANWQQIVAARSATASHCYPLPFAILQECKKLLEEKFKTGKNRCVRVARHA